ncbi:MAG: sirohydrochlorin chelatase [Gemmataceae bacterium]|nr:sirohydrochlorin chelatase [Gemmataceae bacterium]
MTHAVLIVGHGSRNPEGIAEFLGLTRHFRARRPEVPVEISFLEFARPTIQEGMDRLARTGVRTIVVLPGVLMAAGHAKNDMASEVRLARQRYPQLDIRMGGALEIDPHLLQLCRIRYQEALADHPVDAKDTLLLLVGRGSNDPDANGNVAKLARLLQEGYPTAWAAWAYSGIARPLLEEALPVCERAGFRRIVVQPYFLFTGILLKRLYEQVETRRQARPDLEIIATPHLQAHELLIDAFLQRVDEALHGLGHMNCSLCQYRVPIIGAETKLGEPQRPHHYHVQGTLGHVHQLDESTLPLRADPVEPRDGVADPHSWATPLLERLHF